MIKKAIVAGIILLILDGLWLNFFMGSRYKLMIKKIQTSPMKINYYGAGVAYILMLYLLVDVVIRTDMSVFRAFMLGFAVYGVYDMTALAVFKDWEWKLAIIDMFWGGFLYAFVKYISDFVR